MGEETHKCSEGWDASHLLPFVEGELDAEAARLVAAHVAACPECARELDSVRLAHGLLQGHPAAFHLDPSDLRAYVSEGLDPDGTFSKHLKSCAKCQRDADILRGMIRIGSEMPAGPTPLPKKLRIALELQSIPDRFALLHDLLRRARHLFLPPLRVPLLAQATVAAAVLILVMAIPAWRILKESYPPDYPISPERQEVLPEVAKKKLLREEKPSSIALPPPAGRPVALAERDISVESKLEESEQPRPQLERPGAAEPESADLSPGEEAEESVAPAAPVPSRRPEQKGHSDVRRPVRRSYAGKPRQMAPGAPSEEFRALAAPRDAGRVSPIPVRVRIVDQTGVPIRWLRYSPPTAPDARYKFSVQDEKKERPPVDLKQRPDAGEAALGFADKDKFGKGYLVEIVVKPVGDLYDLEGRLVDLDARKDRKAVTEIEVPRGELEERISLIVWSLLGAP